MSDRTEFQAARDSGLRARHETRERRAIRREVAEEIALTIGRLSAQWDAAARIHGRPDDIVRYKTADLCIEIARTIGSKEEGE